MPDVGRAARLRVQRLLTVARHGVDLLERKQRIVAAEHERLLLVADGLRIAWEESARDALVWTDRAAALDGWVAIEAAAPPQGATVQVQVARVMGVEFPDDGVADVPAHRRTGGSSTLRYAADAMTAAIEAAISYAAVRRATVIVAAELVATRTRRRAIEHRWIPHLEGELVRIERGLEELEREENLRVRWAMGAQQEARGNRRQDGVAS
ncbi:V-type ATP synthase subunit D [Demequina sp.]|uniref:V-type ATP synthase subunit D n=1 Tax=Demequina sp. TaxID=2050685 RepID=UPI0025D589E0|nr:V-type ATP synthase subunit D [Demequina sp.]